jgi:hypothetical protein
LEIKIDTVDGGRKVATVNGKTYTLLRAYKDGRWGPWLFLALAGRTPLQATDLEEHWKVIRSGDVYLAFSERRFAYYLLPGGENADAPTGWPKFRAEPESYCFVGLTTEAARRQAQLALEEYRPNMDVENVKLRTIPDECGGPDAILMPA